jgi:hypothetical protein
LQEVHHGGFGLPEVDGSGHIHFPVEKDINLD